MCVDMPFDACLRTLELDGSHMMWLPCKQHKVSNVSFIVLCPGDVMDAAQAQQQLLEAGVAVEGPGGVEVMVMDSLDPALLQMKTEVNHTLDMLDNHFIIS